MPVRANWALLPAYKFPLSKEKKDAAAVSFNRQLAEIQKEASPTAKQGRSPPHLQSPPQILPTLKKQEHLQTSTTLTKKDEENAVLSDQKELQSEMASSSADQTNTTLPPHLRTPDSGRGEAQSEKKSSKNETKLPPHLRTPASRVTPSPKSVNGQPSRLHAEAHTEKIATTPDSPVPLRSDESVAQMSTRDQRKVIYKPTVNVDEEVAASLDADNRINHDGEIAASLQAESFYDEALPPPQPDVTSSLRPEVVSFFYQDTPRPPQHLGNSHGNGANVLRSSTPPHLKTSTIAPRTPVLQEVTKSRHNSHVYQKSRNDTHANGRESAVKAGKRPERNADFLTVETGTTDWARNGAPPPIGEDWDNRRKYDAKGNILAIEFWRPEAPGTVLDTEDANFQTGVGHAGGDEKILSPIDQANHITVRNDDDFSQAKRDQNAAAAVEDFRAQRLADAKSPNSEETEKKSLTAAEKRAAQRARALEREAEKNRPVPPSEFAPAANIYLRPAEPNDMRQCMEIYNQYVIETTSVPELKPTNEAYWNSRFQESVHEYKPFVVAIHMGSKKYTNVNDVKRKKKENLVGFAVAANYGDLGTCHHYSVEMDMFVHRAHLRQGIGGTMLDRMLSALDPGYNLIERAPLLGKYQMHDWVGGGHCICKTVLINILHEADDKASVDWKMKWLSSDRIGFVHAGTLPRIGFRKSKA
ncbi:hypothetical protein P7C71_g1456, partial [Lecanoromycetidae sp. Uapishka_2]